MNNKQILKLFWSTTLAGTEIILAHKIMVFVENENSQNEIYSQKGKPKATIKR